MKPSSCKSRRNTRASNGICVFFRPCGSKFSISTCTRASIPTPVKDIVAGKTFHRPTSGFVAVVNVGMDANWLGHPLAMANLYGYGRLAWNPNLASQEHCAGMDSTHFWKRSCRGPNNFKHAAHVLAHLRKLYGSAGRGNAHGYSRKPLWAGSRIVRTKRLGTMASRGPRWHRDGPDGRHWHRLCRSISRPCREKCTNP